MGKTLVKQTIFPTSFGRGRSQGICRHCHLQVLKDIWRHFRIDVSYVIRDAQTKNNGGKWKICIKWPWFSPSGAKASSFIVLKFSRCFSLSFNVSDAVVWMFLSCSMIMMFPWLLKLWSCLLKCLQAGIALGFWHLLCGYWA